jgi:pSer/pThr/pTyr-binding forkhead associated (FHA) protein
LLVARKPPDILLERFSPELVNQLSRFGFLRVQNNKLIDYSLLWATLAPSVITLSLRHPSQHSTIQEWSFEGKPAINIGRCPHNDIVLHSSVVSRRHLAIRQMATRWQLINFSRNGSYFQGKPFNQITVVDGMIIRLAFSGPRIQIYLGTNAPKPILKQQ